MIILWYTKKDNKYYYRFKDSIIVSDIYADVFVSYSIEIDVQEMLHQI